MSGQVLLLELGAAPPPELVPVPQVFGAWAPAVYQFPAVPVPGAFAAAGLVDAVLLTWHAVPRAEYAIERAVDLSGAPGSWVEYTRTTALSLSVPIAGGTAYWWRIRAIVFGRTSAYTAQLLKAPTDGNASLGDLEDQVDLAAGWASDALERLDDIASDSLLTPVEKPVVIRDRDVILAEQPGLDASAVAFGVTTPRTAYNNAVAALTAYLATLTAPVAWNNLGGNTTIVGATFRAKFADVYTAKQALLDAIAAAAKAKADQAQADASNAKAKTDLAIDGPTGKIKTGWFTARKVAGVDFDGTADISIPLSGLTGRVSTALTDTADLARGGDSITRFGGRNLDNIADTSNYRRAGADYVDASGRVTSLWDGAALRDGPTVGSAVSRATSGLASNGDVNRDVPGARMKWGNGALLDDLRPAQAGADITSRNAVYGPNAIVNPGAETGAIYPHYTSGAGGTWSVGNQGGRLHSGNNSFLFRYLGQTGEAVIAFNQSGGFTDVGRLPEAQAGEVWVFRGHTYDFGTGAGATCRCYLTFRDGGGNSVGSTIADVRPVGSDDYPFEVMAAAPAGTCFASASIRVQTDAEHTDYLIIDDVELRKATVEDRGSGVRVGSNRNLQQLMTNAYGSVTSTTPLSATSAGAVTVNAHTAIQGGGVEDVAYSAKANAVTGLTQTNSYVIYCHDPDYTGGTKDWFAAATINAAMQQGQDVYVAGIITIPTSGTSGGGGNGGGNPDDWCVDWCSFLPDGRYLRELVPGVDSAWCVDVRTGERELVQLRAMSEGYEDCYLLASPHGCVIQSVSTPMDLPDGRVVRTSGMFGELVLPWSAHAEAVDTLIHLGRRRVLKPDFGDRMFYAGIAPGRCLATHNIRNK